MIDTLPEILHTQRLVLRKPRASDVPVFFESYTQDIEVTQQARHVATPS